MAILDEIQLALKELLFAFLNTGCSKDGIVRLLFEAGEIIVSYRALDDVSREDVAHVASELLSEQTGEIRAAVLAREGKAAVPRLIEQELIEISRLLRQFGIAESPRSRLQSNVLHTLRDENKLTNDQCANLLVAVTNREFRRDYDTIVH